MNSQSNVLGQIVEEAKALVWGTAYPKPNVILCMNADDLVQATRRRAQSSVVLSQAKLINAYWSIGGTQEKPMVDIFFNWETMKQPEGFLTYEKIEGIVIHELAEARVGLEDFLAVREPTDLGRVTSLAALPENQRMLRQILFGIRLEYLANVTALRNDVRPEALLAMYASSFHTGITQNQQGRRDKVSFLMRNAPYTWFEYECTNVPLGFHQIAGTIAILRSGKLYDLPGFSQTNYLQEVIDDYLKSLPEAERIALRDLHTEALSDMRLLEDVVAIAKLVGNTLLSVWSKNLGGRILSQKKRLRKMQAEQRRWEIALLLRTI